VLAILSLVNVLLGGWLVVQFAAGLLLPLLADDSARGGLEAAEAAWSLGWIVAHLQFIGQPFAGLAMIVGGVLGLRKAVLDAIRP